MHRKTVEKNQAERMKRQDYTFSEFAHRGIRIKVPIKHIMYSFKGGHVFVSNYLDIKRDRNQIKAFYKLIERKWRDKQRTADELV